MKIGIQGGKGSFNEEAIRDYLDTHNIADFEIVYLFTTEKVLKALCNGLITYGQFAIHNSIGGVVRESILAMGNHQFSLVEEYAIVISHALMIRNDAKISDIDTIMTHPQVLKQCKRNLLEKYPTLKLISGQGDLIDHANVAKNLSENKLEKNIATMGSKVLADIYDLRVIENGMQDLDLNYTSFLLVKPNQLTD
jgi:prephenate dehydratase